MGRAAHELPPVRAALVSLVLGLSALVSGLPIAGALRNVFSDYRDSPLGTYWAIGGIAFGLSAALALMALLAWPRRKRLLACAAALLPASFFPFPSAIGSAGYVLNGALAITALICVMRYLMSGHRP